MQQVLSPESFRLPLSARIWMGIGLLLVPTLLLLLLVLAAGCVALGCLLLHAVWQAFSPATNGGVSVRHMAVLTVVPALFAFLMAFALLKAAALSFWNRPFFYPAVWVNPMREPDLYTLVSSVCSELRTAMPDCIVLGAGPQSITMQHEMTVLNANPRGRTLGIGLPLMACLTVNELRAVIYHELAHFTGGDIRYTKIVAPAYRGIVEALDSLEQMRPEGHSLKGGLYWCMLDVPRYILLAYARILERVIMHALQAREYRVDAIQAHCVGSATAASTLRKLASYPSVFYIVLPYLLEEIRRSRDRDESVYRLFRKRVHELEPQAKMILAERLAEPEDPYDHHPSLARRLAALPQVPERFHDTRPALALLRELKTYEKLLGQYATHEWFLFRKEKGIR